jgi:NADH:ubiquinone reductase (H+-translocating)
LGGGSVGLYAARRLRKRLGRREAAIVVVDPRPYMTYAPFLPEVAAGSIHDADVVAPHRRALKHVDTLQGRVTNISHATHKIEITPEQGEAYEISYDYLIVGLGSIVRTLPIPGLAEQGIGFKNVEEASALRNQILNRINLASSTWDTELRRRMLTFTFIGGGFAGVEALAETEDMARAAVKSLSGVEQSEVRFVMIEGSDRILPELTLDMANYAFEEMRKRGIEFHLSTFLSSCVDGHVVTSTGVEFDTETIVWTAGVKANPVLSSSDLPVDSMSRLTVLPTLQVVGPDGAVVPNAWGAGDCAAVPDLFNPGKFCPPNAQHAIRQATVLADNLFAMMNSDELKEYKHKNVGTVASLGLHKGVAIVFGSIKLRGFPAWLMHRAYHISAMPTVSRKVRITTNWIETWLLRSEVVPLGSIEDPRAEFRAASTSVPAKPTSDEEAKVDVAPFPATDTSPS